MLRRLGRTVLTMMALMLVAGTASFLYVGWRINDTGARDQAQQAEAIVVLGAHVEPNGQPGPDLRVRTLHAVSLFQRGLAPYVICTGGYDNDRLSAAAVAREFAISQGVPREKVLLADGSMTTREDASSAARLMVAQGWRTAILVSHPLHLERASLLFEGEGIAAYPSPTSTNLRAIPWQTRAWLTSREAVGIIWICLEEMGLPDEWTTQLSRWVTDPRAAPEAD